MQKASQSKFLFVINPVSGGKPKTGSENIIREYMQQHSCLIDFFLLQGNNDKELLRKQLNEWKPDVVIAVGGDGTIKLVAEQIIHSQVKLGIVPAGSANGLATDLNIPMEINKALDIIIAGNERQMDVLNLNQDEISLHLSDIGLNALLIKYFERKKLRGKIGYVLAVFKAFWFRQLMNVQIQTNSINVSQKAFMIVLANATKYGSGAVINPEGNVFDGKFEVIIVRRLSLIEILKMLLRKKHFNPQKIYSISVEFVTLTSTSKVHFQVDGEYRGKVKKIEAKVLPAALKILVP